MTERKIWYGPTHEEFMACKPVADPSFKLHSFEKQAEKSKQELTEWNSAETIQNAIDLLSGNYGHYLIYWHHVDAVEALKKFGFTLHYEEQLSSGFDGKRGLHCFGASWNVIEISSLSFKDKPSALKALQALVRVLED